MRIIAVIPAYNEAGRIVSVVQATVRYVDQVIVVDDGSTDGTGIAAEQQGALVLRHRENCGAGAATMTGIDAARALKADVIVTLDADEQHDPGDIPHLLKPVLADEADIVFANRFGSFSAASVRKVQDRQGKRRNHIPLIRRIFNGIGNIVTFAVTGRWVTDSQCGFKVFGPRAVAEVDIRMRGFEYCTELVRETVQRRWRMAQVPIKVLYSEYTLAKGQSFANGVKTALKILLRSFLR
ncbi:MAG: glycosyltransferase family 2 protein [Candidatus Peregrinibacteria bacterium]